MSGNPARVRATQERRRSNAAGPHGTGKRGEVFEPDYLDRDEIGVARVQVPGFDEAVVPVFGVSTTGGPLIEWRGQRRYIPADWCLELELDEGAEPNG